MRFFCHWLVWTRLTLPLFVTYGGASCSFHGSYFSYHKVNWFVWSHLLSNHVDLGKLAFYNPGKGFLWKKMLGLFSTENLKRGELTHIALIRWHIFVGIYLFRSKKEREFSFPKRRCLFNVVRNRWKNGWLGGKSDFRSENSWKLSIYS